MGAITWVTGGSSRVVKAVRQAGRRCVPVAADTSPEVDVEHAFDRVAAALGPFTGLVDNAAVTSRPARLATTIPRGRAGEAEEVGGGL